MGPPGGDAFGPAERKPLPQVDESKDRFYTSSFPFIYTLRSLSRRRPWERGGCMGRCCNAFLSVILLFLGLGLLAGCGSSSASGPVQPPASLSIFPSTNASMDIGSTLVFSASTHGSGGNTVGSAITFQSSNTAVLTISSGGEACAGSWNSLTNPITCTPGAAGVAQVTAVSEGVSSPPVTVSVHEHVDNITISPTQDVVVPCLSATQVTSYKATAFSRGKDITSTVGPFNWTQGNSLVVTIQSNLPQQNFNEVQATAIEPGLTTLTASAAGVASPPFNFETCPVQSITLNVEGESGTSLTLPKGTSKTITPTIVDSAGNTITKATLTYTSSNPAAVTTSSAGSISTPLIGGGDITVSCTPPSCNMGFTPPLPIYANTAVAVQVAPTTTNTGQSTNAFATTTGCGNSFDCTTFLYSIVVPANTLGSVTQLPHTPNSFVFSRDGTKAYLGSDNGLMILDPTKSPPGIATSNIATGRVLAVSPDGNLVIVSDTSTTPNQGFVFNNANASAAPVNLLISGATAASFSRDGLKAYILAGTNMYVYSVQSALRTVALAAPANDVTFLPVGAFAYLAGGSPSAVTVRVTCTDNLALDSNNTPQILPTRGEPLAIRALLDGTRLLALDPPGFDIITAITSPVGCSPTVSDPVPLPFVDLGQGDFTPLEFLTSSDGTRAYVIASDFQAVLQYDIFGGISSALAMSGNATTLGGDLTLDGTSLYVGGSDGKIHVLSTISGGDVQQIALPANSLFCGNVPLPCDPDLVRVQP
jgi:hypothetical protein